MAELSYQQFMRNVNERLGKFSEKELRELILSWASDETPAKRETFLAKLTLPPQPETVIAPADALLKEIEALAQRVEDGEYCDGWGWDDDFHEERDWGDESWSEEVDAYFRETRDLLLAGQYRTAETAYRKLFAILDLGREPGHLPGDPDYCNMLEEDLAEQTAAFLRTVYHNTPLKERAAVLYDTMMEYCGYSNVKLADISEVIDVSLPDFEVFLRDWISLLKAENGRRVGMLLREAVLLQGGLPALIDLARQYVDKFPKTYLEWIATVEPQNDPDTLLPIVREGLTKIPRDYLVRAEVAQTLVRIGKERKDRQLELEGCREGFISAPSTPRLVDLYLIAHENGCFETVRSEAEARIDELFKAGQNGRSSYSWHDNEQSVAWVSQALLYNAWLLGGNYAKVFEKCQDQAPLGWSSSENPRPYLICFMLAVLSGAGSYSQVFYLQWDEVINNTARSADAEYPQKYRRAVELIKGLLQLTKEQEEFYLNWCIDQIGRRADAIVSNQHRGSYYKAAQLLTAAAETLANRGRKQEGLDLVERYRNKYPRHTTFKSEVIKALQLSRLFGGNVAAKGKKR
jgi:hypothetical protein